MAWEGLNRRRFPRAKYPCLIKIFQQTAAAETMLTHTQNISVGGLCVIIKKQLDIFSSVGIEIDLMDGDEVISCRGKIVWVVRRKATEELKPSFYDTGIEYLDLLVDDRLRLEKTIESLTKGHYKAKI